MRPLERIAAQAYFQLMPFRLVRTDRSWADHFGRDHGGAPDLERLGYQAT
jgi:hypothetical protein